MQKTENLPAADTGAESAGRAAGVPLAGMHLELIQRLADRVVQDAQELSLRIKREGELEAARLIEKAEGRAQDIVLKAEKKVEAAAVAEQKASFILEQARQAAITIVADATKEGAQARLLVKEDIEKQMAAIIGRVRTELRPSLDYLIERTRTLEDEIAAFSGGKIEAAAPTHVVKQREESVELQPGSRAGGAADRSGIECSSSNHRDGPDARVGIPAGQPCPVADLEMVEGNVEIDIAPPVIVGRFLTVMRFLENTPDIKVLQTSGSWTLGSVITISLYRPLPLVSLLEDLPTVAEAKMVGRQGQDSCADGGVTKILVTLKAGGGQQANSAAFHLRAS